MAATIAGCGPATPATTPLYREPPLRYLLAIDRLVSPDFVVDSTPRSVTAGEIAAGDSARASQLTAAGLDGAAREDFFRQVANLALLNGPAQIGDTVERFASIAGATTSYDVDVARLNMTSGSAAISTGALGDAAHAVRRSATTADGVKVAEITVEWRLGNLVNVLVVRGRLGGVRPDDALLLAHRQTVDELSGATAAASPTPRVSP